MPTCATRSDGSGMVGNHVADIVARYGASGAVPQALTDYIAGRTGYDYNQHGQAGNTRADFVPDEIVDRFTVPARRGAHRADAAAQVDRRRPVRRIPPTQQQGETLRVYGEHVIPALRDHTSASRESRQLACGPSSAALGIAALVGMWEGYRAVGPSSGWQVGDTRILPRASDLAMPHVTTMISRLTEPTVSPTTPPLWRTVVSAGVKSLGIAGAGWAIGTVIGLALAMLMQRFVSARAAVLPWVVLSPDRSTHRHRPLVRGGARNCTSGRITGRTGCRCPSSPPISPSFRSRSAHCGACLP